MKLNETYLGKVKFKYNFAEDNTLSVVECTGEGKPPSRMRIIRI